ncbi:MAG TPA: helix-turn-helix transcriptional regulator [Clostridia bacterium]|nr:helix-turn-helix transcriptional regulator [Clostridia bacterium]
MSETQLREAICSELAKLLKELRIQRGLSMTKLAAKAGLSRPMISFVEQELRNPTIDTLLRIASVLEVDLADIIRQASKNASRKQQ